MLEYSEYKQLDRKISKTKDRETLTGISPFKIFNQMSGSEAGLLATQLAILCFELFLHVFCVYLPVMSCPCSISYMLFTSCLCLSSRHFLFYNLIICSLPASFICSFFVLFFIKAFLPNDLSLLNDICVSSLCLWLILVSFSSLVVYLLALTCSCKSIFCLLCFLFSLTVVTLSAQPVQHKGQTKLRFSKKDNLLDNNIMNNKEWWCKSVK